MKNDSYKSRKFWKQSSIILISFLMIFTAFGQSTQITSTNDIILTYTFPTPTLDTINIDGILYDRVNLLDCSPAGSAGDPKIPSKGTFILLPPESQVSEIIITPGQKIILGSGLLIEPTSQAIPMSQTENQPIPIPNEAIYQSNAAYPGELFTQVGIHHFRGYQILVLLLHPIQYHPVTGELCYYKSVEVAVKTTNTGMHPVLYRNHDTDKSEVENKVDNPSLSLQYNKKYASPAESTENYDLLIITTDALKNGFEPLKQAHDDTGVETLIKTLTDIGASDKESIRNYIRNAYTEYGIEYVLIGGDSSVIPAPMLWVSGMDENVTYYEDTMPSDLYYACLDGPYNYDGDGNYGEPTDGENGGDVDLIAEVYVGRACVDNINDVNSFVTKTIAYINKDNQDEFYTRIHLVGEFLGNYGIASYSGVYLDQLVNGSTEDGYTTIGIPANNYTITKLYDSPDFEWTPSDITAIINNGTHIINHLGHSSYGYNLKLNTNSITTFTNPSNQTCFIYSQGCMAGGFDNGDCIAEYFTTKTVHAAFAGIWNARYGFFWSYSTDGDSQRLHRQFWDAVFNEKISEIGRANHDSKEDNLPIIGRSCIRWCYYETNLFGDPSLRIIDSGNQLPKIVVESISGGIGISAVITNMGDATATNFDWSITTDGTVVIGKEKTGTATLEPDESITIKTGLMLGFGPITVTVNADKATKSQDFKLLFILTK